MKRILVLGAIIIGSVLVNEANAQFHVSINIGAQPAWGPTGYDYAEYYYLPDIEAYYCVPSREFVYFDDGRWIHAGCLPPRYSGYDLYGGYKVVLNERDPWCHFREHREVYAPYRYRHDQVAIRDYRGGYYGRPYHEDRGLHRGWYKDRDRDWDEHGHGHGHGWGHDRW